jgi:hypothetical protein
MNAQLNSILLTAVHQNKRNGVTGALLFENGHFVQILEGEEEAVRTTMAHIERDKRHRNIRTLAVTSITARAFDSWWMGCAERNQATEHLFAAKSADGRFDPGAMTADDILRLMTEIERVGFARERAAAA